MIVSDEYKKRWDDIPQVYLDYYGIFGYIYPLICPTTIDISSIDKMELLIYAFRRLYSYVPSDLDFFLEKLNTFSMKHLSIPFMDISDNYYVFTMIDEPITDQSSILTESNESIDESSTLSQTNQSIDQSSSTIAQSTESSNQSSTYLSIDSLSSTTNQSTSSHAPHVFDVSEKDIELMQHCTKGLLITKNKEFTSNTLSRLDQKNLLSDAEVTFL